MLPDMDAGHIARAVRDLVLEHALLVLFVSALAAGYLVDRLLRPRV